MLDLFVKMKSLQKNNDNTNDKTKDNDRKYRRNESCMQRHLYEHFYSEGHNGFLGNVSVSFIDKADCFQPKKRENYWMRTLKTLAPLGLNIESIV